MRPLFAATMALALAACSPDKPTVIDGSSPAAFDATTEQARREIPDADRLVFDRALHTLHGRRFTNPDVDALARVTFDGMTGAQVVADQKAREQQGGSTR